MKKLLMSVFAICGYFLPIYAQNGLCGFDLIQNQLRTKTDFLQSEHQTNLKIQEKVDEILQFRKLTQNLSITSDGATEIPIVVHVIYKKGDEIPNSTTNPSDAHIMAAIDRLNADYTSNPSTTIPLKFVLAKRTPNCQNTSGIIRVDASHIENYNTGGLQVPGTTSPGATEKEILALSQWSSKIYLNIWVVWKINAEAIKPGGTVTGFARLPLMGNNQFYASPYDGVILRGQELYHTTSTLSHEIGHTLGLYHTFEGNSNGCPSNTDCSNTGDLICDTDPVNNLLNAYPWPTNETFNPCSNKAFSGIQNNIMGYGSSPLTLFTNGQKDRMLAVLQAVKIGYTSSQATLIPPSSYDIVKAAVQIPGMNVYTNDYRDFGPCSVNLNHLTYSSNGFSGDGSKWYIDNTCNIGTNLSINQSHHFTVTTRDYAQRCKAWIDFNNDGSFDPKTELVLNSISTGSGIYTHSGTITKSMIENLSTVKNKKLRFRIMSDRATQPDFNPGSTLYNGQTEDFWVQFDGSLSVVFGNSSAIFSHHQLAIQWHTQSEFDNDHFLVEGSKDGKQFITLTTIKSKAENGNSNASLSYSLILNSKNGNLASSLFIVLLILISLIGTLKQRRKLALASVIAVLFIACNKQDVQNNQDNDEIKFIRITQVDKYGTKQSGKIMKIIHE
ncbi:MAG: hypothetical protein E6Q95_04530 [Chitinophagaceae bacterium]|nr:MAG: hypothetical protein E6Q95_04530 [Chitinophagaceae bacterium]